MRITVVTPNLNGMAYLPRCVASVRDQPGMGLAIEHVVVDGGSTDGSAGWLARQPAAAPGYSLRWISEADRGMYDAIRKGWRLGGGETLAWLNSDEQYLPGAAAAAAAALDADASAGFVYGDTLVLRPDGSLIAFRKAAPLRRCYLLTAHLYVHSAALFVRRAQVAGANIWPDPRWRAAGDHEWMLRLLESGARGRRLRRYLAVFVMTGVNLGGGAAAARELRLLRARRPFRLRALALPLRIARACEKALGGGFTETMPLTYRIVDGSGRRVAITAQKAGWKWPNA